MKKIKTNQKPLLGTLKNLSENLSKNLKEKKANLKCNKSSKKEFLMQFSLVQKSKDSERECKSTACGNLYHKLPTSNTSAFCSFKKGAQNGAFSGALKGFSKKVARLTCALKVATLALVVAGSFALSVLNSSCEVGLGPAVDLIPPRLVVTTPTDNDTKPYTFMLNGYASDNEKLDRIEVDFGEAGLYYRWSGGSWSKNTALTAGYELMDANKGKVWTENGEVHFRVSVDLKEKNASYEDNSFTVTIQAFDEMNNNGKNSKREVCFNVDEKDPNVSITSPNLLIGSYLDSEERTKQSDYSLYKIDKATGRETGERNGASIGKLLNGDFVLQGRQEGSQIFSELLIELDGDSTYGTLDSYDDENRKVTADYDFDSDVTCKQIAENEDLLFRAADTTSYFTKRMKLNETDEATGAVIRDLRNFEIPIDKETLVAGARAVGKDLTTGRHLIRVVTTSVSASGAWERRVQGFFVWEMESDIPWAKLYSLDESDKAEADKKTVYPASSLSGYAQDDDGVKSVTYKIERAKEDGSGYFTETNPKGYKASETIDVATASNLQPGASLPTFYPLTIKSPAESDNYRITISATDANDLKCEDIVYYFMTLDVQAPKLDIELQSESGNVLLSEEVTTGSITSVTSDKLVIAGFVSDDGELQSVKCVYINGALTGDKASENLTDCINITSDVWKLNDNITDSLGNKLFVIPLGDHTLVEQSDGSTLNQYKLARTLSIKDDLGIDGKTKFLTAQQFIFMATDKGGTSSTPQIFTLQGDNVSPGVTLKTIQVGARTESFINSDGTKNSPTFEKLSTATLRGTFLDENTTQIASLWAQPEKMLSVVWSCGEGNEAVIDSVTVDKSTTPWAWQAQVSRIPSKQVGLIKVTGKDFAGNSKSASANYYISTDTLGWVSVDTGGDTTDGTYKAGGMGTGQTSTVITLITKFTSKSNVTFAGGTSSPRLLLNAKHSNGSPCYAIYSSGNGGDTHTYTYTVSAGDYIEGDAKLDALSVEKNGNTWTTTKGSGSGAVSEEVDMSAPGVKLSAIHDIRLDTTAPTVLSVTSITRGGYYKAESQLQFKVAFSEPISVADGATLTLAAGGGKSFTTTDYYLQGEDAIVFNYTVPSANFVDPGTTPLKVTSLSTGSFVSDVAGNLLGATNTFTGDLIDSRREKLYIDTVVPAAPKLTIMDKGNKTLTAAPLFIFEDGAKLVLAGEQNASIYYKMQDDASFELYSASASLSNNGVYNISAYQTDLAGNKSSTATPRAVTVDKGVLLQSVTSDTSTGLYKAEKVIDIYLNFRKDVTIPNGSYLLLNTTNSSNQNCKAVLMNGTTPATAAVTTSKQTFRYTVSEGDKIASNTILNILGLKTSAGQEITSLAVSGSSNLPFDINDLEDSLKFTSGRSITILTGAPSITGTPAITGDGDEVKLTVHFSRELLSKVTTRTEVSGEKTNYITLTQTSSYIPPIVMSTNEYDNMKSKLGAAIDLSEYYEKGTNGATVSSNGKLTFDTTTKYILKKGLNVTYSGSTIASLTAANSLNTLADKIFPIVKEVKIPIYAKEVQVSGTVMTVSLSGSYKLPTLGGTYTLAIDDNIAQDAAGNLSTPFSPVTIKAQNVEPPVIRVSKKDGRSETINTTTKTATQQLGTTFRIDSRTVGSTITYGKSENQSPQTTVIKPVENQTVTTPGSAPLTNFSTAYRGTDIQLGDAQSSVTPTPSTPPTDRIIVHAQQGAIYYWTNNNDGVQAAMTSEGGGWYTYTIMKTSCNIIFKNNTSSWDGKTNDLNRTAGEWWWNGSSWSSTKPSGQSTSNPNITYGLKIAIGAKATMNGHNSVITNGYACRSILYFEINSGFDDGFQVNGLPMVGTTATGKKNEQGMWVRGGDSDKGANGVMGLPLCWDDKDGSGIHLMTGSFANPGNTFRNKNNDEVCNMQGTWYYATWELTTPVCFGFVLGDVPADASTNGPKNWITGSCSWTSYKTWYKLNPGETLWMKSDGSSRTTGMNGTDKNHGSYDFKDQDKGER